MPKGREITRLSGKKILQTILRIIVVEDKGDRSRVRILEKSLPPLGHEIVFREGGRELVREIFPLNYII